ncbi:ABC transporter ATP-binding protein [Bacillus sp. 03113]|uniref:ABC transporter ATP-binding protein n=1 Tax=Bacillus sp. 03113 TaxID=2578211 RepID=UPI001143B81C|nr:ABC transporter transmembrane domain-containing protein [Bacillus sp. 03113]
MEKNVDFDKRDQRQVLWRLLAYAKPYSKKIIAAFCLLLLSTLGEVIGPILVKIFIDDYVTTQNIVFKPLFYLATAYMVIQILHAIITYFQLLSFQEIALFIIKQLRIDIFTKVHSLGLKYFDKTPGGSIVSRVTNDTEAIKEMFVNVLATFIQSIVMLTGILTAMFFLDKKLAVFCIIIVPVIFMIIQMYRRFSSRYYADMRERLSELNAKLSESIQGMAIIQIFRQEERLKAEFGGVNEKHFQAGMRNIKLDALLLRPAIDLVFVFTLITVLSFFGLASLTSPIKIGVIYAFVNYLHRFFEPVNQVMMRLSMYQQAIVAASRVFKLLDEETVEPDQLEDPFTSIEKGEIQFKNISFSYDGKKDVLKNITFTAKQGETIAFVGHTGSGKSSIINLLMRFYEFEHGDILIDGKSIKHYSKEELRSKMGLVLQDPFLFYGTVKNNIRLYDDSLSDEDVIAAAEFVQADTFIESLEKGYDHKVVERGSTFSSGQRQLIAFARTIATNPKILVLDEATANIDTETEEAIQVALSKMRKGRTTIAIAHRLSTIQDADTIYVLHQGEIAERGNHQELLAKKGIYYKMYLLQNGGVEKLEDVIG